MTTFYVGRDSMRSLADALDVLDTRTAIDGMTFTGVITIPAQDDDADELNVPISYDDDTERHLAEVTAAH